MNPSSAPSKVKVGDIVSLAKDAFALLRDFSVFVVFCLLIIFPSTFNSILTDAGFEEGSFAGLKWKRHFYDTDVALRSALDTITALKTQNSDLIRVLNAAANHSAQPSSEIALYAEKNEQTIEAAAQVQASVKSTLTANEPLVDRIKSTLSSDTVPPNAFCYQEDKIQTGTQQFSVHCHASLSSCELARGPNPRTKQSACQLVDLSNAQWRPNHPGWMGSWYEFRSEPFPLPFPQIQ